MIRIDSLWLAVEPMDMRAGADRLLARSLDGAMPQAFPITATPHDGSVEGNPPCVSLHLLSPLPAGTAPTRSSFRKEVLEVSTASAAVRRACRSQATAPSVTSTP